MIEGLVDLVLPENKMEVKNAIYKEFAERIKNMNEKEISVDGTVYGVSNKKFDIGEGQKIIDKELASPKGPDDFGGEDYPSYFKEEVVLEDYPLPPPPTFNSKGEIDFDPNHDVEKVYRYEKIKSNHDYPPLVSTEELNLIKKLYQDNPSLQRRDPPPPPIETDTEGTYTFNLEDAWIQTYSGRRFTPTNPNPDAVVIQDIAHALSMLCRFGGHSAKFYSVAQHCVLVSHICDFEDAFWGLMHDASEAYLVDLPRPIKHSGKFESYIEYENKVQLAICKRFNLSEIEPASVKKADKILLATEARDLLPNLRSDWTLKENPLPFKISPLGPREAKDLFMKRFFDLANMPGAYEHYLYYENQK